MVKILGSRNGKQDLDPPIASGKGLPCAFENQGREGSADLLFLILWSRNDFGPLGKQLFNYGKRN